MAFGAAGHSRSALCGVRPEIFALVGPVVVLFEVGEQASA